MSISKKDEFNQACKRLGDADRNLGVLCSQMLRAKERAIELASKGLSVARTLPVDSDIAEHAAAASERARNATVIEGERVYWAELHAKIAADLDSARSAVAAAERDMVNSEDEFWRARFAESCAAFFQRNRADLRDMFGAFARMRRDSYPDLGAFFDAVLEHGPQNADEFQPGIDATAKVLAPPVRAPFAAAITRKPEQPEQIRREIEEANQSLVTTRKLFDECWHELQTSFNGTTSEAMKAKKQAIERRKAVLEVSTAEWEQRIVDLRARYTRALLETEALRIPKA